MSGPGLSVKDWFRFGRLLPRSLLMLVMLLGVVSLRGAPVALPTLSSAQFKRFFDCGRAVRCLLPIGAGRFFHW